VQIDPNFASAWARLSRAQAFLHSHLADTTPPTRRDAAKTALGNAQRLEPNSPETLLALGYYQYWVLRDYGLAKTTFKELSKLLPGSSEVPHALGFIAGAPRGRASSIGVTWFVVPNRQSPDTCRGGRNERARGFGRIPEVID